MTTTNQYPSVTAQPGIDYCQVTITGAAGEIINRYKCNQKKLSVADVWNILRQRR